MAKKKSIGQMAKHLVSMSKKYNPKNAKGTIKNLVSGQKFSSSNSSKNLGRLRQDINSMKKLPQGSAFNASRLKKFKKGGKVKKTGAAILHKGERVLNKKQAKKWNQKKWDKARKSAFGIK